MTAFLIVSAVMLLVAVVIVVRPLLASEPTLAGSRARRLRIALPVVIGLPVAASLLYPAWSNFEWDAAPASHAGPGAAEIEDLLRQLEAKLEQDPGNVEGWMMLGRSYVALGRFARGVEAYEKAYELTDGQNPEIATGLAEALALVDEASLTGRAGRLFEQVLATNPDHPKALWYGAVMALRADNLDVARERMQRLLAQNPPQALRSVLEQQLADLDAQPEPQASDRVASASDPTGAPVTAAGGNTAVVVEVTIAETLRDQIDGTYPLFVLARDPASPGPPLAAVRRMSNELPVEVMLSAADAMLPGRTIESADRVEIVARVAKGGGPSASSGDLYGQIDYQRESGTNRVSVVIDRVVP